MSAKIFLRRLTDIASFDTLQDKLHRLNDTYLVSREHGCFGQSWHLPIVDEFAGNERVAMYRYD